MKMRQDHVGCDQAGQSRQELPDLAVLNASADIAVSLLTGGSDRPYVFGLTMELISKGAALDVIGSEELDFPEFRNQAGLNFFKLRGDQRPNVSVLEKALRLSSYYARLIGYAATAKPKIVHILWNNRFELFDRTVLMCYYRLLGKKIALTAHNVNADKRDGKDSWLNRLTLRIQYRLAHQIFVHTDKMQQQLMEEFGVGGRAITVIPFGINNAVPNTELTVGEAKRRIGVHENEKTILSFGRITPYKGLEYLFAAFRKLLARDSNYRLIIAGKVDRCEKYWAALRENIREEVQEGRIVLRDEFVPDDETEVYFKAADALVLSYRDIYQSGVLFLGHSFGLPVLASDVGSFKDEIVEGKTGFVFKPEDPLDMAAVIESYFESDLYLNLNARRSEIRDYAAERHSWDVVGQKTMGVYASLLCKEFSAASSRDDVSTSSVDVNAQL
jgi:D-inositol-3-phosphate glycosyltransferase